MKYLKLSIGFDKPVLRTIFCHPDDNNLIHSFIKSNDIIITHTNWMALGHCVITPDIEVDTEMTMGYDFADIQNNEFTIVLTNYFK